MKLDSKLGKACLFAIVVAIVLLCCCFLLFIAIFSGNGEFYAPVIIVGSIGFLVLVFLNMYHILKSKNMKITWITFLFLLVLSCGIYEGRESYDRSILRVREKRGVDLMLYAPFAEETKAVFLDGVSSLKLDENLPILDGATALYPLYSTFAQAVYPNKTYNLYNSEVMCNNTILAYNQLIHRTVDVIFVAPPSKQQLENAEKGEVTFNMTPIGKEAFVFFVNAHNPVDNLTVEQLRAIYSGKIKNWEELGGNNEPIRPFQRNEGSGSQSAFLHFMEGVSIMEPLKENVAKGMGDIISQTADYTNYSNAIGFSFRFFAREMVNNKEIKLLRIEGIYPDTETIKNNTYPLASQFYAVTLSDNTNPNVLMLLEWITSEQGQGLVEKVGYCAL